MAGRGKFIANSQLPKARKPRERTVDDSALGDGPRALGSKRTAAEWMRWLQRAQVFGKTAPVALVRDDGQQSGAPGGPFGQQPPPGADAVVATSSVHAAGKNTAVNVRDNASFTTVGALIPVRAPVRKKARGPLDALAVEAHEHGHRFPVRGHAVRSV